MRFNITTLSENHVAKGTRGLMGEHGLSFYIEAGDRKLLFDTGQNLAIGNNARVLGIDLSQIDTVVLSHGHYDHTGGLQSVLESGADFKLCAHPDVFSRKVKKKNGRCKYIGIPLDKEFIADRGVSLELERTSIEIAPGIITSGEIPLATDFEEVESGFFIKNDNEINPDTLADDQALILDTENGIVVLLGCSHRGVINTLNHIAKLTRKNKIQAILGGLHLMNATDAKLKTIIDHIYEFGLEKIGVGHCTGTRAFVALSNEFRDRVFLNTVGNTVKF